MPEADSPDRTATEESEGGWFLYLLECRDGSLYTGVTTDPLRRLREHNAGTASRYTRSRLPVKLIYQESCADRSQALRREAEIKRYPRAEKLALTARRPPRVTADSPD